MSPPSPKRKTRIYFYFISKNQAFFHWLSHVEPRYPSDLHVVPAQRACTYCQPVWKILKPPFGRKSGGWIGKERKGRGKGGDGENILPTLADRFTCPFPYQIPRPAPTTRFDSRLPVRGRTRREWHAFGIKHPVGKDTSHRLRVGVTLFAFVCDGLRDFILAVLRGATRQETSCCGTVKRNVPRTMLRIG